MKPQIKNAVEEYQCSGCVCGSDIECYKKEGNGVACEKHVAGTMVLGIGRFFIGRFFIGMPIGFNRLGPFDDMKINIFENYSDGWNYDTFNVPVWKYLNGNNNTIVRGISPRTNIPFLHVFLKDCMSKIGCIEITEQDIKEMD